MILSLLLLVPLTFGAAPPPIVGGEENDEDAVVLLVISNVNEDATAVCSGARVGETVVLTAAHCLLPGAGFTPASVKVVAAASRSAATGGNTVPVTSWSLHPDYDEAAGTFDAALLFLESSSPGDTLPLFHEGPRDADLGEPVRLVGFGAVADADDNPDPTRRAADVPLYDFDSSTLYTYDPSGDMNACFGDSGGPMLRRDIDGDWAIAAVTGFVSTCEGGSAGGARSDAVLPWVQTLAGVEEADLPEVESDTGEEVTSPGDCECGGNGTQGWLGVVWGLALGRRVQKR